MLDRRRRYRARLADADYLVVRALGRFLDDAVPALAASGTRVLDVGCGEQPLRAGIESAGATYVGVDVGQNAAGTVDVIASAECVPLPDASFDVVLCTEVLEHVPDADAAMRELARLVAPGGHVVLTAPFAYRLHEEPHDFRRVTSHQVRVWSERTGLEVVRLETLGDELDVLATTWAGLWEATRGPRVPVVGHVWRAARRVPILAANVLTLVAGAVLPGRRPRKAHLSVAAVLRRPGGAR